MCFSSILHLLVTYSLSFLHSLFLMADWLPFSVWQGVMFWKAFLWLNIKWEGLNSYRYIRIFIWDYGRVNGEGSKFRSLWKERTKETWWIVINTGKVNFNCRVRGFKITAIPVCLAYIKVLHFYVLYFYFLGPWSYHRIKNKYSKP